MDKLEYGIIKEYEFGTLWYEPITDENDGFILRDFNQGIISIYTEDEKPKK